jgi:hypothetical protein
MFLEHVAFHKISKETKHLGLNTDERSILDCP